MCVEMPDGMHTKIKRRVILGSAKDLLLSPRLRVYGKTGPENDFISLESGKNLSSGLRYLMLTGAEEYARLIKQSLSFSPTLSGLNGHGIFGVLAQRNKLN